MSDTRDLSVLEKELVDLKEAKVFLKGFTWGLGFGALIIVISATITLLGR